MDMIWISTLLRSFFQWIMGLFFAKLWSMVVDLLKFLTAQVQAVEVISDRGSLLLHQKRQDFGREWGRILMPITTHRVSTRCIYKAWTI